MRVSLYPCGRLFNRILPCSLMAILCLGVPLFGMTLQDRREYLDRLLEILPDVPTWNQWLETSGELPPDFDGFPRQNGLPDPMRFLEGRAVTTPEDWQARRKEIRSLFDRYAFGSFPPRPKLDRVEVEETSGEGYRTLSVVLHFGPESKGVMHVTLILPEGPGPYPFLMGPSLVGGFGNIGALLLRRGYATVSYAGSDFNDDTASFGDLYPDDDFAKLPRRAWAVGLVLDYLETLPEIDMKGAAIYGYSRDGKQAAIAAALDERIDAVIAGSTGVGGVLPYRLAGERNAAESIESTTRMFPDWFHPRLRFFSGREDRLPIDGNLLVALIAPRACLMTYGRNDEVANTWGNEECYRDALKVYQWLGAADRVGILRVPGFHGANDMQRCLDWLDIQFGRSKATWTNDVLFPWNYDEWRVASGETVDLGQFPERHSARVPSLEEWTQRARDIRKAVRWMLGEAPPMIQSPPRSPRFRRRGAGTGPNPGQTAPIVDEWVIARNSQEFGWRDPARQQVTARTLRFGDNVQGKLYLPVDTPPDKKLPTVIWLHGYNYPLGYMWVYRRDLHPVLALARAGYAVLAYDQCGFGSRMGEIGPFYDRYPHWSQMGRLVEDVQQAVTALQQDAQVDPNRIALFGYSLGGAVALHAAALDDRIQAVVSVSGFTPMRTDTADKGTGGIARYSIERGILPRLGFFVGEESRVPYDYDELLALIAPRPTLIVAPLLDRDGTPDDVRRAVERAQGIYALHDAADKLALRQPWDYTRLPTATQDAAIDWMNGYLSP